MKTFVLFLISLPLLASSIFIDCGSSSDQYFNGGTPYTVQPAADSTLRFSSLPFTYKIPVPADGPYTVKLNFLEPSSVPPARAFSVSINDQVTFPRLTMPGYLVPFSRSALIFSADGFIAIRFDTLIRSAVVSSIEIAPFQSAATPTAGTPFRVLSEIAAAQPDGTYALAGPTPLAGQMAYDIAIYRNGLRQRPGFDYQTTPQSGPVYQMIVQPSTPWGPGDAVLADYTVYFPPALPSR